MIIDGLTSVGKEGINGGVKVKLDFNELLRVALHENIKLEVEDNFNIKTDEMQELQMIKKLMEIKGKDSLIKFLKE